MAQACIDHVRGGVRPRDGQATHSIDLCVGALPHGRRALGESAAMDEQPLDWRLDVENLDDAPVGQADGAVIGELAAHFGVERGSVQHDLDLGRSGGDGLGPAIDE